MNDLFKIGDLLSISITVVFVGFLSMFLLDVHFVKEDIVQSKEAEIKVSVTNYGFYESEGTIR